METPTNNHQLFTITKMKRFARTGLLACSGACISLGLLTPVAHAEEQLCGTTKIWEREITGDPVTYASDYQRTAKDGADRLAEKSIDSKARLYGKNKCPSKCPTVIEEKDIKKSSLTYITHIDAYLGADKKKDFLDACVKATEIDGYQEGQDKEEVCADMFWGIIDPNSAYIAGSQATADVAVTVTCPPERVREYPKTEDPISELVEIAERIQ